MCLVQLKNCDESQRPQHTYNSSKYYHTLLFLIPFLEICRNFSYSISCLLPSSFTFTTLVFLHFIHHYSTDPIKSNTSYIHPSRNHLSSQSSNRLVLTLLSLRPQQVQPIATGRYDKDGFIIIFCKGLYNFQNITNIWVYGPATFLPY